MGMLGEAAVVREALVDGALGDGADRVLPELDTRHGVVLPERPRQRARAFVADAVAPKVE